MNCGSRLHYVSNKSCWMFLPWYRLQLWPHTVSGWSCSGLCSASWQPVWCWWPISPWWYNIPSWNHKVRENITTTDNLCLSYLEKNAPGRYLVLVTLYYCGFKRAFLAYVLHGYIFCFHSVLSNQLTAARLSLTLFEGHQVSSLRLCAGDHWGSPLTGALQGFPPQPAGASRKLHRSVWISA